MALASVTKFKVAVTLFVVAFLLDSSLLVSASLPQQHSFRTQSAQPTTASLSLLASPAGIWAFSDGKYSPANMSTRGEIMSYILTNPGVYMREISEDLGLPMGVVQYHIWVLGRDGQLEDCRSGRYRRFFRAGKYGEAERRVLSLLRQGTTGRILLALSEEPLAHMKLASILGLSSQALSWHTKRLRELHIIETVMTGKEGRVYRLDGSVIQELRAHAGALHEGPMKLFEAPVVR